MGKSAYKDTYTKFLNIIFRTNSSTSTEGFIGLLDSTAALTALPTTARHVGLFWDLSANANYVISSSDGTTQSTNNTGEAVDAATRYRLFIRWTAEGAFTVTFLEGTGFATQIDTSSFTGVEGSGGNTFQLHFFVQTEALAAKEIDINEWRCSIT